MAESRLLFGYIGQSHGSPPYDSKQRKLSGRGVVLSARNPAVFHRPPMFHAELYILGMRRRLSVIVPQ